jgi:acyl carrier protein
MRQGMNVEDELRVILRKKLAKDAPLDRNTKLADAGLDSLDIVEIAFDVEDKFRIQLPQVAAQTGEITFLDLYRLIEERLAAQMIETAAVKTASPVEGAPS